ncbi:MAG: stalk domain-containing protein [Desulfocucumaceae bacterium]
MKKGFLFVLITVFLCTVAAFPALAEEIKVNINSDPLKTTGVYISEGVTMINLGDYTRFAGADVNWPSEDTAIIQEDGKSLSLTVNQLTAKLNDEEIKLPKAPVRGTGGVIIPLRAVANAFGYDVQWDGNQNLVSLSRKETREEMTPTELLVKSGQASQKVNTYSMQGAMNISIKATIDGKAENAMPQNMKSDISGQFQNKPMKMYMMQTIDTGLKAPELQGMTAETYLSGEKMYIKMPGQKWAIMDVPIVADLLKQQQDIQSNPLKAVEQMKEMGILSNYGNDVTIGGQEYYVVNAAIDMNKFKEGYQKMIGEVVKSLPAEMKGKPESQNVVQDMLKSMEMEYYYTTLINKETLISDIVRYDIKVHFSMNVPKEPSSQALQKMDLNENVQGEIKITDLGKPFVDPDVSSAVPMEELIKQQVKE